MYYLPLAENEHVLNKVLVSISYAGHWPLFAESESSNKRSAPKGLVHLRNNILYSFVSQNHMRACARQRNPGRHFILLYSPDCPRLTNDQRSTDCMRLFA